MHILLAQNHSLSRQTVSHSHPTEQTMHCFLLSLHLCNNPCSNRLKTHPRLWRDGLVTFASHARSIRLKKRRPMKHNANNFIMPTRNLKTITSRSRHSRTRLQMYSRAWPLLRHLLRHRQSFCQTTILWQHQQPYHQATFLPNFQPRRDTPTSI